MVGEIFDNFIVFTSKRKNRRKPFWTLEMKEISERRGLGQLRILKSETSHANEKYT
jgi:hypothetical protein